MYKVRAACLALRPTAPQIQTSLEYSSGNGLRFTVNAGIINSHPSACGGNFKDKATSSVSAEASTPIWLDTEVSRFDVIIFLVHTKFYGINFNFIPIGQNLKQSSRGGTAVGEPLNFRSSDL